MNNKFQEITEKDDKETKRSDRGPIGSYVAAETETFQLHIYTEVCNWTHASAALTSSFEWADKLSTSACNAFLEWILYTILHVLNRANNTRVGFLSGRKVLCSLPRGEIKLVWNDTFLLLALPGPWSDDGSTIHPSGQWLIWSDFVVQTCVSNFVIFGKPRLQEVLKTPPEPLVPVCDIGLKVLFS